MPINYDNFFSLMRERGQSTYTIRRDKVIGQTALNTLKTGKGEISTSTIARIYEWLDCQPGDFMRYEKE